jgi:hypothetical protein
MLSVFKSNVVKLSNVQSNPDHSSKHQTRLENPVRNKHSSLLGPFVSYEEKSFVNAAKELPFLSLPGLGNEPSISIIVCLFSLALPLNHSSPQIPFPSKTSLH